MDITLRAPEPKDIDFLYRLENDAAVDRVTLTGGKISRQMLWEYIDNYSADIFRDKQLRFVVERKGEAVGTIDIYDFDPINSHAFIGIAVDEPFRGSGIGRIALRKCCSYCRDNLSLHQLAALVSRNNEHSQSLFLGEGFKTAGCLRSWVRRANAYEDVIILQKLF